MLLRKQPSTHGSCLFNSRSSSCHASLTHCRHRATDRSAVSVCAASACNRHSILRSAGRVSSSRSLARSAGVICRNALAPRPQWAAPTPPAGAGGSGITRMVTARLGHCETLVDLSDIYDQWGGSFDCICAAAAIHKYAKLSRRGRENQLLPKLLYRWQQLYPDAEEQACANVLWALSKLGTGLQLWVPTFDTYLKIVQRDMQACKPQSLANVLGACAKLGKQPAPDQLKLLMQAVLRPEVLAATGAQDLANVIWAVGKLSQSRGWRGGVDEPAIQQLLGQKQLLTLSSTGTAQAISNVVVGLAFMASAAAPVISKPFAQQCSTRLLDEHVKRLVSGNNQDICNTLWACGELGLADAPFVAAAAAAAANWTPTSWAEDVGQATTACVKLRLRHGGLMQALMHRAQQLVQQAANPSKKQGQRAVAPRQTDLLVGFVSAAVVHLDMEQLAPQAVQLVRTSGIGERPDTHPSNLQRMWMLHSWLLQHQLLDGRGLTGLLNQQQLQQGQQELAMYPDLM